MISKTIGCRGLAYFQTNSNGDWLCLTVTIKQVQGKSLGGCCKDQKSPSRRSHCIPTECESCESFSPAKKATVRPVILAPFHIKTYQKRKRVFFPWILGDDGGCTTHFCWHPQVGYDPGELDESDVPRPVRHFTLWLEAGHPWDVLQLPSSRSQHSASA